MTIQNAPAAEPRPRSVSSHMSGISGLIMLAIWLLAARNFGDIAAFLGFADMPERAAGGYAALLSVFFCGLAMGSWSIFVDKVHRNASTGIDWSLKRSLAETLETVIVKLAGYWVTWLLLACFYGLMRYYWNGAYVFAMDIFTKAILPLIALSIPYCIWVDSHMVDPRKDAVWHFGNMIAGRAEYDPEQVKHHLRNWTVKGFFTAFMISILPGGWEYIVWLDFANIWGNPVQVAMGLITIMFLVDVQLATVGYLVTAKPLDTHIRSANPFMQGWVAALMCYPPFVLMGGGALLSYREYTYGEEAWAHLLAGHDVLLWIWAAILVFLTGIYAWATMAFGMRFSNLTNRGVITHGPYAWTKHPAYLSKNSFWWLSVMPFVVTTGSFVDAIRNVGMISIVSLIYYWRARTEEAHMRSEDPDYVRYEEWMAKYAPVPRFFAWIRRRISALRPKA